MAFAGSIAADATNQQSVFSSEVQALSAEESPADATLQEESVLTQATSRDITQGIEQIEQVEEQARIQAEKDAADAKAAEAARIKAEEDARVLEEQKRAQETQKVETEKQEEGSWLTGLASAYNIASSSTQTASGATLDETSLTVAVPASQKHLLGRSVEISWNGITVVAVVTDTGGFASYGRALDLAPGVCAAFGVDTSGDASNCNNWGVQTVKYRFL